MPTLIRWITFGIVACISLAPAAAEDTASGKMTQTVRHMWPAGMVTTQNAPGAWGYEEGVLLDGMTAQWHATADGRDFAYIKASVDKYVGPDGTIKGYAVKAHSLDNIEMGRATLLLYRVTQEPRYYKAAKFLVDQLAAQPRTTSGGYWHKQIYPNQMWLDGAYMAAPFRAAYAVTFQQPKDFDDIAGQMLLMDRSMRVLETGLMRHGWDESRSMPWADKTSGLSPEVWARALGWYAMALVDVLEWMPLNNPHRPELIEVLNRSAAAIVTYQDKSSGLWWQVMDKGGAPGNFTEASASCMFVYALAKGSRLGILPASYQIQAQRGWDGIQKTFVQAGPDGNVKLTGTVKSAGLGGKPYRSGSYAYYIAEKVIDNDAKGIGAYLMAGSEVEKFPTVNIGHGKTVLMDAWFNSQKRKNSAGETELFHYKWDDDSNSGFGFFGRAFQRYGVELAEASSAPSAATLEGGDVYIIASPDTAQKSASPHMVTQSDGDAIEAWVKEGGVLVLMQNDAANAEFEHFNTLADRFGIHFNPVVHNHVQGDNFAEGRVEIPGGKGVFTRAHHAFMKDICTITVRSPASAVLTQKGEVLMAVSRVGKGSVYAVVDPWLYNEYTDGRKLPPEYDNFAAAIDLASWLLHETE